MRSRHGNPVNDPIDRETLRRLRRYASHPGDDIAPDLERLEREWDVDRAVQMQVAALGIAGLALGLTRDRRWLAVPGLMLAMLGLHATRGWCPSVPFLRALGFRSRRDIERERYALKAMRGDFEGAKRRSQVASRAVRS